MKILLKHDSRDKVYKNMFGQVVDLPEAYNTDRPLFDDVQPLGSVQCVAYTACDIAEDQDGVEYDIEDLWARIPKSRFGSDPRDVLKEIINNGLLPKGGTERVKKWKSFWRADVGIKEAFDNVRSAIFLSGAPIMLCTYWYAEWLGVPNMGVMPIGKTTLNGHAYSNEGWVSKVSVINDTMFLIEPWVGRKMLMPKETFNEAMKPYGMQAWVLSTSEIDAKRQKTILETIKDLAINTILLLRQLIKLKGQEPVASPVEPTATEVYNEAKADLKTNMIEKWAKAIDKWEGNTFGNNPGNLKYSTLIASFGAKKGRAGSDGGHFAVFDTPEQGFKALCNFLELGCKNQLKSYKKARTLQKFMVIYAGNPPQNYIVGISKELGVSLDVDISTFL